MEATLIDRIGDAGKKLHRTQPVTTRWLWTMRLYTRARVAETDGLLRKAFGAILDTMENNLETYMPGLPIYRRHSPLLWLIIMVAYFECSRGTDSLTDI